jgi:hypothetical protein
MPAMSTVEQAFCRSRLWRWFIDLSPHRLATISELRARLEQLPFDDACVGPALGGLVVRFAARRIEEAFGESS